MRQLDWKKNTAVFMTSQAISLFGSSLVQLAITWYITRTTGSGIYVTLSIIFGMMPALFLSPFAGVWADRYDRKKLIMISDGCIATSTFMLAIVFLAGYKSIWLLLAVSVLRSLGSAVQMPSVGAMLPDIVPEEQLTRINGINGSIQALITIASPALAGVMLTWVGSIELIFFVDVFTAAIAIFVLLRYLYVPQSNAGEKERVGYLEEMKLGFAYIRKHRYLVQLFLFSVFVMLSVAPVAFLTPLQVVRSYGNEVFRLTAIELAFSGGMLVGGLAISAWGGFKNKVVTIAVSLLVMGGSIVLMGANVPFWFYLVAMGICGLFLPLFNTPSVVMLQEKVDPAYIGRVFSVMSMINSSVMPMGILIFGPLADKVSIELLLVITGIMMLFIGFALFFDKTLMEAGKQQKREMVEG